MSNLMMRSFRNVMKPCIIPPLIQRLHGSTAKTMMSSFQVRGIFSFQNVVLSSKLITSPSELHFAPLPISYHSSSNISCQPATHRRHRHRHHRRCFSDYVSGSAGNDHPYPSSNKEKKRKAADALGMDIEDQQPLPKKHKSNPFLDPIDWDKINQLLPDEQPDDDVISSDNHLVTRTTTVLEFQEKHEAWVLNRLKEISKMEQALEVGVEVTALVNLLKLFDFSDDQEKHNLVSTVSIGAEKIEKGLAQVKEGQDLLREAIVQML